MDTWLGQTVFVLGTLGAMAIRAPYGRRRDGASFSERRHGWHDAVLLAFVWTGMVVLPVLSIATDALASADYALRAVPFGLGVASMVIGLWLFWRAHADLGRNWSLGLELRTDHRLVTTGVYRWMRHPMYTAILLLCLAQALVLPNAIAGPAYLAAFTLLCAIRIPREERMMTDRFAGDYERYSQRTPRLVPGIW